MKNRLSTVIALLALSPPLSNACDYVRLYNFTADRSRTVFAKGIDGNPYTLQMIFKRSPRDPATELILLRISSPTQIYAHQELKFLKNKARIDSIKVRQGSGHDTVIISGSSPMLGTFVCTNVVSATGLISANEATTEERK